MKRNGKVPDSRSLLFLVTFVLSSVAACGDDSRPITEPPGLEPPPVDSMPTFATGDFAYYTIRRSATGVDGPGEAETEYQWEVRAVTGSTVSVREIWREEVPALDLGPAGLGFVDDPLAKSFALTSEWNASSRRNLAYRRDGEDIPLDREFFAPFWVPPSIGRSDSVVVGDMRLVVVDSVPVALAGGVTVGAWSLSFRDDDMEVLLRYEVERGVLLDGVLTERFDQAIVRVEFELESTNLSFQGYSGGATPPPLSAASAAGTRAAVSLARPIAAAGPNQLIIQRPFRSTGAINEGGRINGVSGEWLSADLSPNPADGVVSFDLDGWARFWTHVEAWPIGGFFETVVVSCPGTYRFDFEGTYDLNYEIWTEVGAGRLGRVPGLFGVAHGTLGAAALHRITSADFRSEGGVLLIGPYTEIGPFRSSQTRGGHTRDGDFAWSVEVSLPTGLYVVAVDAEVALSLHGYAAARTEGHLKGSIRFDRITISWQDGTSPITIGNRASLFAIAASDEPAGCWDFEHAGEHSDIATINEHGEVALLDGVTRAAASFDFAEDGTISGSGTGTFIGTQGAFGWDNADGTVFCMETGPLDLAFSFELTGRATGDRLHIEASELEVEVTSGIVLDCFGGALGLRVMQEYLTLILEANVEAANGATDERSIERSEPLTTDQGAVIGHRETRTSWRNTVWLGGCPGGAARPASVADDLVC